MNNVRETKVVVHDNEVYDVTLATRKYADNVLMLFYNPDPMARSKELAPFLKSVADNFDSFEYIEAVGVMDESVLYHVVKCHGELYYISTMTDSWDEGEEYRSYFYDNEGTGYEFKKTDKRFVEVYGFQEF